MSSRPDSAAAYLWDALNAARNVQTIGAGLPSEQYVGSLLHESAAERQFEIVGEALRNLRRVDPGVAERIPHVHRIIAMRNILILGYAQVNGLTVWTAATEDGPPLIAVLEAQLADIDQRTD